MRKTVRGIRLDIDPGVFGDILTLEMLADTMTPLPDDVDDVELHRLEADRIRAIFRLSRRIYGDAFERVYGELADKHGGYVSADEWAQFLQATFEQYQKNQDARPADGAVQGRARS